MTETIETAVTPTTKRTRNQNPRFVITHAYLKDGEINEAAVAADAIAHAKKNKDKIVIPPTGAKTPRGIADLSFFGDKAEAVRVILNTELSTKTKKLYDLAFMLQPVCGKEFSAIMSWIAKNKKSTTPYFKTTTGVDGGHQLIAAIAPLK